MFSLTVYFCLVLIWMTQSILNWDQEKEKNTQGIKKYTLVQ